MTGMFERIASVTPHDLTLRQLAILSLLDHHPHNTLGTKDVAAAIGVAKPVVTRAIKSLDAAHLAGSICHPRDLRKTQIYITHFGREVIHAAAKAATP